MFRDSAYQKITPYRFFEESTQVPDVFPAYTGNGMLVMSVDASGLQGLNHGVPEFANDPTMGDMYLVRHGMIADSITPMNHAPLGWFSYTLMINGEPLNEENLARRASNWNRCLFLDEARVETSMIIDDCLSLTFGVWMPYGKDVVIIDVKTQAYDHSRQPVSKPVKAELCIKFHFTNRRTDALLARLTGNGQRIDAVIQGHETYCWSIAAGEAGEFDGRILQVRHSIYADNQAQTASFVFRINDAALINVNMERADNRAGWQQYFDSLARVRGRSGQETFLYNNSLYLCRACFTPALGIPIGFPFSFPPYWHSSTFWDSTFVMDGLMAAGDQTAAAAFLEFLLKTMRSTGKPYAWMCLYDGTPSIDSTQDIAPLVLAAHAMTAIRYYTYYQEKLQTHVFPIVSRVCEAILPLFGQEDGAWKLMAPVSHDVCEAKAFEKNHTFTGVWFVSVLSKYAEYAAILNIPIDARVKQIVRNYKPEMKNGEYAHCANVSVDEAKDASWIPFLLYPTEAMPFIDMNMFAKTRAKHCFNELYMSKQGSFQPWTSMNQAMSDWRLGNNELANQDMEAAYKAIFGPGFFSEIGPHQQTGGLPPYITAHGVYLAAYLYPFVHSALHTCSISFFTGLTRAQSGNEYRVERAQVLQNARVDAVYTPGKLTVQIHGMLHGVSVTALVPQLLSHGEVRLTADMKPVQPDITRDRTSGLFYAHFALPEGAQTIWIE